MKVKYVSILAIVLVLTSGIPFLSGAANYANTKYATNTHSQANTNDYNNGAICGTISPLIEAYGTASSPMMQVSNTGSQGLQGPPGPQGPKGDQI